MARKTRRTEIQIETHEVKIIRFSGKQDSVHCDRCQETVSAFTHKQTAELLQMNLTDVCGLIEADKLHLVRTTRGLPLVCGNSLGSENKTLTRF